MSDVPPLIMLAEGRKPRPRKPVVPRPRELALHMAVAKLLRDWCREDWQWTHFPAGEKRESVTITMRDGRKKRFSPAGARLKRMGLKRGWSDFILVGPSGRLHALELKRVGESLDDNQEGFRVWCVAHGVPHIVADDFSQVLAAFAHWGCLRSEMIEALRATR